MIALPIFINLRPMSLVTDQKFFSVHTVELSIIPIPNLILLNHSLSLPVLGSSLMGLKTVALIVFTFF